MCDFKYLTANITLIKIHSEVYWLMTSLFAITVYSKLLLKIQISLVLFTTFQHFYSQSIWPVKASAKIWIWKMMLAVILISSQFIYNIEASIADYINIICKSDGDCLTVGLHCIKACKPLN